MSGEIDFDLPLLGATVYHNTPGTDGVWNCVINSQEGGLEALKKIRELFESEGLNSARIHGIEVFPIILLREGGEDAGSGPVT